MLNPTDSRNFSRTFCALNLVLGPLLLLIAGFVGPAYIEDDNAWFDAAAAAGSAIVLSSVIFLFGILFLVAGLVGVIHLTRGRTVTVAQVGASLMIFGAVIGGSWFLAAVLETTAAQGAGLDREQMISLFDQAEESPWLGLMFVSFLGGIVLGSIVLAVGLLLRRAAPVWAPVAIIASTVLGFLAEDNMLLSHVSFALLVVGFAGVAWRIWQLTDEQWAQWQPLPEPGNRRGRRTADVDEPAPPAMA